VRCTCLDAQLDRVRQHDRPKRQRVGTDRRHENRRNLATRREHARDVREAARGRTIGCTMDPPAASEYAVDPVGVATMMPSAFRRVHAVSSREASTTRHTHTMQFVKNSPLQ
jgi:hypothetical protein